MFIDIPIGTINKSKDVIISMAYIVKCTVAKLVGDDERFPCRFGYKVGDYFIYGGEQFIGRVSQTEKEETRIWLNFRKKPSGKHTQDL